jgi:tetratricopeptide (TPR) repeat protein
MTRSGRAALSTFVALALVVSSMGALAAPNASEREARRHFSEAELSYRAGHYADALAKYQAGYAATPLPGFLVNIAQCQRRLGDLKAARATYREFVLVAPDSRLVPEVQTLIKELDTLIADLAAGGPAETAATAGNDSADVHATDPSAPPLSLAPVAPAEPPAVVVATPALVATPTAVATERPPARSHARWWIWGGIAAAALAGGVVTGIALSSPGTTTIRAGTLGTLSR